MSRIKQNQSIDGLILVINTILENRCSYSEKEVKSLEDAIIRLNNLKRKKGKTNKEIQYSIVNIVSSISDFFVLDDSMQNDKMH